MAFTFLNANGYDIGKSLLDEENIEFCREMISKHSDKIILPIDIVVARSIDANESRTVNLNEIADNEMGLDIGEGTIKLFEETLKDAKTIIWNGPVGVFEKEPFANGTKALCEILKDSEGTTILGGGDTASAAINMGYKEDCSHISTGGGASLELLEGKTLPGIEIIKEK